MLSKLLNKGSHPFWKAKNGSFKTKMNFQNGRNTMTTEEDSINTHDARELLGTKPLAKIMLDQETYLLKITKQNKLILTK